MENAETIRKIGEVLTAIGRKDPYFSESFDIRKIVACISTFFLSVNEDVSVFINPPLKNYDDMGDEKSIPELANAFVFLDDGEVWCLTTYENEYNLAECLGDSADKVLKTLVSYYEKTKTGV